jgi:hypothetical protein
VHALPSPPAAAGASPLPLRLEYARLGIFKSVRDDVEVERVFISTVDPRVVLVTATAPRGGVYATGDGGRTWSFAELDMDDERGAPRVSARGPPRLFWDVLFDPRERHLLFARSRQGFLRSEDGGASWSTCPVGSSGDRAGQIDAAAIVGGALLVARGPFLYSSDDEGRTWSRRTIRVEGIEQDERVRVRSIVADPADPRRLMLSLHAVDDGTDVVRRIASMVDGTSDLGLAALALVDDQDPRPQHFSLGAGPAGVLVSADGGIEWRRSGLRIDAWLVWRKGAVYALAADPVLEAATLARQHPELADALRQQIHGLPIEVSSLRSAFEFPKRERLLLGPLASAPLFRSTDGGASWARVSTPELSSLTALRAPIDRQRGAWMESPSRLGPSGGRPPGGGGERGGGGAPPGGGGGGRGGRMGRSRGGGGRNAGNAAPRQAQPLAREGSAEVVLAYLDPVRLLSRYNADRPLTGVAPGGGRALIAWLPAEAHWSRLAEAALSASDVAGEISLGPGYPASDPLPQSPFALLRSADEGASWEQIGASAKDFGDAPEGGRRPASYPESIAGAEDELLLVLGAFDRDHHRAWHRAWRWLEPAAR